MGTERRAPHHGAPSRPRIALRFLIRSLRLRGPTFLLALGALTIGAAITATILGLRADLGAKLTHALRGYGANLLVAPRGGALDPDAVGRAAAGSGTASSTVAMVPMLLTSGTVRAGNGGAQDGTSHGNAVGGSGSGAAGHLDDGPHLTVTVAAGVVGADLGALRAMNRSWRLDGTWPEESSGACVIGVALAQRAGLREGSTAILHLPRALPRATGASESQADPTPLSASTGADARAPFAELTLTVAAVASSGESADDQIFVDLVELRTATGAPPDALSLITLAIDGGPAEVTRAAAAIEGATHASARPLGAVAAAQGAVLGRLGRMMGLLTAVVLALSGMCLVTTLMTSVVERQTEIGIMRSIGAGDGEITRMFVGEIALLAAAGALLGSGLGAIAVRVIGWSLFGTSMTLPFQVLPVVAAITFAMALIAVLVPLRRALAVQPAVALRGD